MIAPSRSARALLRPLGVADARIEAGFWAERQRLNRDVLLPDGARRLAEAGNFDNLRAAAAGARSGFRGLLFTDSDLYKWLEALGWELARAPSGPLARMADEASGLIAAAQEPDGYLNSYYQVVRPGERLRNLAWDHELYCAGHLIQAAIAHARGRRDGALLAVAQRFADHLDRTFGPGRRAGTPGHPEIEMALVELCRLTGERRYLELAGFFVDQRGRGTLQPARLGSSYFQDHLPVRAATQVTGHAVRALYLAAGVTDLYLETGEELLLEVMRSQWHDMVSRKTYITGAVGARHVDEGFGDPYELPPDRCYGETCAAIASIMWSWRMLLATGEARCADLIERILYNGFLAGVALDGGGYSYVNPLHVRDERRDPSEPVPARRPWFECACCPPNAMRLLATVQHYLATADAAGLQVHQYASATLASDQPAAGPVAVRLSTDYPWDGRVELAVLRAPERAWTLSLRIPAWCAGARVDGPDGALDAPPGGYARATRRWRPGERVLLDLPMPPRLTVPHHRIDAVRGCVAIERGPLVYCLEGADAPPGTRLDDLAVDPAAPLEPVPRADLLGGIVAVAAAGMRRAAGDGAWPYAQAPVTDRPATAAPDPGTAGDAARLLAVPYALWGNRGEGAMRVWMPAAGRMP